jgi:hypothetical protein
MRADTIPMRIVSKPLITILALALVCELTMIMVAVSRSSAGVVSISPAPDAARMAVLDQQYRSLHGDHDPIDHRFAYAGMTPVQQRLVGYYLASAAPLAQLLAGQAADDVEISLRARTDCGMQYCTATGVHRAVSVQLLGSSFGAGAVNRFVLWHELGHAIDRRVLSEASRSQMLSLLRASAAWQSCFAPGPVVAGSSAHGADARGCLDEREIIADQLAIYATGSGRSLSGYRLPMLYDPSLLGTGTAGDLERVLSLSLAAG